jgi:hypothetical protein
MEGEVVTSWASDGLALYWGWDLRTDISMGVRSWWSRVPTCGLEIRLDGQDEENQDVNQRWVKVYHEDQRWEAVLRQISYDERMSKFIIIPSYCYFLITINFNTITKIKILISLSLIIE